ncbi:hypothetical protein NDI49_11590 [Trichocoleus sp. ST-U3]|uniref:hypothetical protein n=1 Tax=Coleofasciculus sp. FACHB-542 TaxID=2692787 RepID=UPI001687390A|nr:hypothetical protein [Coleofasciculus sp. FACHB-542]MBD2085066.1 hypothetical protein [Coleofasciculus sp. FACHB-542]
MDVTLGESDARGRDLEASAIAFPQIQHLKFSTSNAQVGATTVEPEVLLTKFY